MFLASSIAHQHVYLVWKQELKQYHVNPQYLPGNKPSWTVFATPSEQKIDTHTTNTHLKEILLAEKWLHVCFLRKNNCGFLSNTKRGRICFHHNITAVLFQLGETKHFAGNWIIAVALHLAGQKTRLLLTKTRKRYDVNGMKQLNFHVQSPLLLE